MNLLFYREGCPFCREIRHYLDKRDAKMIKDTIKFVGPTYHEEFKVDRFPTLILADGKRLVGDQVFDWLRQQLSEIGVDPDSVMTEHSTGYWEGNLKFVGSMFLLASAVKYWPC